MRKQSFFSLLNITGLSTGIAVCLLILLYINHELSYDTFHEAPQDLYRVSLNGKIAEQELNVAVSCPPLANALLDEVPEVANACRIYEIPDFMVRLGDRTFMEKNGVYYADSSFFEMFAFKLLRGDTHNCLTEPNSIVLSESLAQKYFGKGEAIGQTLVVGNDKTNYKVTGVVQDAPQNTQIPYTLLLSMSSFGYAKSDSWFSNSFYSYIRLVPNGNADVVKAKVDEMVIKYGGPQIEQFLGTSIQQFFDKGGKYGYFLEPMLDIHLKSAVQDQLSPGGNIQYVYILSAIALFILLIACVNFMNLSTARATTRAKEVGVRKVLGAQRSRLIFQFITESTLFSLLSLLLALVILAVALPYFNDVAGKQFSIMGILEPEIIGYSLLLMVLVGLGAGSYPAFYLTAFQPVEVLKGRIRSGLRSGWLRNGLVVFQFALSICMLIATAVVTKQLQYMQDKNLGFDRENILVIKNARRLETSQQAFMDKLRSETSIKKVSTSNNVPPHINNTTVFRRKGHEEDHILAQYYGDWEHLATMGMELKAGRSFSRDFPSDTLAALINESAVEELGLEKPLEAYLVDFNGEGPTELKIVGVIKDFHYESLKNEVRPLVLKLTDESHLISVRIAKGKVADALAATEQHWNSVIPGEPFEYAFVDQEFNKLFKAEKQLSQIFLIFTVLAVLVTCLGLFGLAAYTSEQRIKEIGVRKVLGASVQQILFMLNTQFTWLVLIAFAVVSPITYFLMDEWLTSFAYRTAIGWDVFVFSAVIALSIAWFTVSAQSWKAARTNPVNSLKSE